jgi:hypothetical protein
MTWTLAGQHCLPPRLILATAAVRDPVRPCQVTRDIQGACSCNGAPPLAPSCSSRRSTYCPRSPCSHTRHGRNRAERFVCQAYEALPEVHPPRGVPLVSITDGALGCRRLGPQGIPPHLSTEPPSSHLKRRPNFRSIGDSADRAISGPAECDYGCGVAIRLHVHVPGHERRRRGMVPVSLRGGFGSSGARQNICRTLKSTHRTEFLRSTPLPDAVPNMIASARLCPIAVSPRVICIQPHTSEFYRIGAPPPRLPVSQRINRINRTSPSNPPP